MPRLLLLTALLVLCSIAWPLARVCPKAWRTALRSAWCWSVGATAIWVVAAALALGEPRPGAWTWLGYVRLLAAVAALGPLVAVLGARWPGARAWNLIVLTVLVVFSLPVLAQWLSGRQLERARVGMDVPQFVLYWAVAVVGILNYVTTRYAESALALAASLAAQSVAVGPWTVSAETVGVLGVLANMSAAGAAWLALPIARPHPAGWDGAWLRLRDGWGSVWALRVLQRWNAAARLYGWPIELTWRGFRQAGQVPGTADQLQAAEQHFRFLLRRFGEPDEFMHTAACSEPTTRRGNEPDAPGERDAEQSQKQRGLEG